MFRLIACFALLPLLGGLALIAEDRAILGALVLLVFAPLTVVAARRLLRRDVTLAVDASGLEVGSPDESAHVPWRSVEEVVITRDGGDPTEVAIKRRLVVRLSSDEAERAGPVWGRNGKYLGRRLLWGDPKWSLWTKRMGDHIAYPRWMVDRPLDELRDLLEAYRTAHGD